MFNDISYLYSDECFTSSYSNEKELSTKVSNDLQCQPNRTHVSRKSTPVLSTNRRSKHIILFNDDTLKRYRKCERNRISSRHLKENRQLFEDFYEKLKELEKDKSHKQDSQIERNQTISMDFTNDSLLTEQNKTNPYSNGFVLFDLSTTNVRKLNNDSDQTLDD
jgi:hypothetical protein